MKLTRSRPLAVALALAAAAVVFGADTTSKKKPGTPTKPAPAPSAPAEPSPAPATPADAPAAAPAAKPGPEAKPAPPINVNEIVATVDGEEIKRGEVETVIREVLAGQGAAPESLSPTEKDDATRQVLDNLIMEHIVKKATVNVTVTDADIAAEISKIKEVNKLSEADFAAKLKENGKTLDDLKKEIREGLTQRKWFDEQTKGKLADATEAEAKDFYDKNTKDFESQEMVRASHILFTLAPDATPEKVEEVLKKAQAAADRAQKEDFAKLAGELTEEPGGKERGGDLDFFSREQMVPEFSDAAFKLKPGETTKSPVRSKFGYHIIKATDHKDATKQPFPEVKKDITDFLTKEKRQKMASDLFADLKSKAKIDIKLPPPPPAPPAAANGIPPELLEQIQKAQQAQGAKPAPAPAAPVEAVTPPVSVPPTPKK